MRFFFKWMFLTSLCLIFIGCSSTPKTEQVKYEKKTHSMTYQTYRKLSKELINPMFKQIQKLENNEENEDHLQASVNSEYTHNLLALLHSLYGFNTLALAEADLALQSHQQRTEQNSPLLITLTYQVRAYALHANGLNQLADESTATAKLVEQSDYYAEKFKEPDSYIKLLLGLNALVNKDYVTAELMFANSAERINQPWLPRTIRIAAMAADAPLTSMPEIITLLKQPNISESERIRLTKIKLIAEDPKINEKQKQAEIKQVMQETTLDMLVALGKLTGEVASEQMDKIIGTVLVLIATH